LGWANGQVRSTVKQGQRFDAWVLSDPGDTFQRHRVRWPVAA